jgi:hypothetical protein
VPEGRAYVHDGIERLVMDGYDYHCLEPVDDDVLLLEWDIAIGRQELVTFAEHAQSTPDRVRVAPYPIYRSTLSLVDLGRQVYPFRLYNAENYTMRWVTRDDKVCHTFGFGVIYLPRLLVKRYLADKWPALFNDMTFSQWHYLHSGQPEVPIEWDCPAVHLNYTLPEW